MGSTRLYVGNIPFKATEEDLSGLFSQAGEVLSVKLIKDAATGRLVKSFGGHRDIVYDAELSPDETLLATAGYDVHSGYLSVTLGVTFFR